MALVFGFGGIRDFQGRLSFEPRLPDGWKSLSFTLRFRDRQIKIDLSPDEERYGLAEGDPLDVVIRGEVHSISTHAPTVITQPSAGGA